MMTLEQERDQPKGATGGEAAFPAHPSLQASPQPALEHPRLPHPPHLSPKVMKPTGHPTRRPRTPVRQLQVDASTILSHDAPGESPALLGTRQGHRSVKSQRSSPIQGHRSPLGKRSTQGQGQKHGLGSSSRMKGPSDGSGRRGSETGVAQKQKKLACEVVVPPLPPPPDSRSQCRVQPQPASVDSAESVNLMDLSSDTEQGTGSVDLTTSAADVQSMDVEFSGAPPPPRAAVTPLASPVWAANTVGSTYHTTSPTATISPSRAPTTFQSGGSSPRRSPPTVLSPVVVSMSIVGGMNSADTVPLLEPTDMTCDASLSTGDTVPLLARSADEDATIPPPAKDYSSLITLGSLHLPAKLAVTPDPTGVCAFVSPAASVTALQMENSPSDVHIPVQGGRTLPLLGLSPACLAMRPGDTVTEKPDVTSPTEMTGITSPAPLSTPDLRVDMFEADYPGEGWAAVGREGAMKVGSPPAVPSGFPAITPEDLTPAELHEFDMKYGSPHHARSRSIKSLARPTLLALPLERPRLTSLPVNGGDDDDDEDYYRLRHFSITGRRIVNRGDSFKSRRTRSNTSMASDASRVTTSLESGANLITSLEGACRSLAPGLPPAITLSCDDVSCITDGCAWSHPCSLATSAASSAASSQASSASEMTTPYRVVMLGAPGVGKTTLVHQFMTSEHINAYDNSLDEEFGEHSVSVMLDGEESEIMFIDHPADEMTVENYLSTYEPHAFVVAYSVIERASYQRAEEVLQYLWRLDVMNNKGVILVANKTDIVRSRCVTPKEGSNLADSYDCKYIETSSGFNHQVDELLVGVLKQIRLKTHQPEVTARKRSTRRKKYRGSKTSASLKVKSFLTKVCGKEPKSKSCENLHVL
ncbi:uncharacterized protein [Panulirus ornatus]